MNWATLTDTRAARWASGAFALSATVMLVALVRAIRLEPVPEAPPLSFSTTDALARRAEPLPVDIRAAVEHDPFSADRTAPAERYRIPGEADDVRVTPIDPPKPVVLGIALSDSAHSFATCTLDGGVPTIVRVGNSIGNWWG